MTFSGKPNSATPAPAKRRSILGTMFNPRIGDSVRPIGESLNIFTNLLALVFAMNGLFPKDHPALRNEPGVTLRLSDVIHTAWSSLSFTKQGLPKVILFVAIIGGLLCAIFSILTIFAIVFMGQAHAQAYFTPGSPGSDVGFNIIDYLFGAANGGAKSTSGFNNLSGQYATWAGGTMPNMGYQNALWAALGYYSNAMLVFAGIVLFYHLLAMIVDTAHSGVVMGRRANQIWAPIRLAVAVILLVPVNGLNAGQMLVMQMAQWGSGLASNVWSAFKLNLAGGGKIAALTTKDTAGTVLNIIQMAACEYNVNHKLYDVDTDSQMIANTDKYINGWTNGLSAGSHTPWDATGIPVAPGVLVAGPSQTTVNEDNATVFHFQPITIMAGQEDMCGYYVIPPAPSFTDATTNTIATLVYNLHITAFNAALASALQYATYNVPQFNTSDITNQGDYTESPLTPTATNIYEVYQSTLNNGLKAIAAQSFVMTDKYAAFGWIGAGAYFGQVSNLQGALQNVARSYIPHTAGPKSGLPDGFADWVKSKLNSGAAVNPSASPIVVTGGGACGTADVTYAGILALIKKMGPSLTDDLLEITNYIGSRVGVWCGGDGGLGIHFTGSDPLAQMAGWGHTNMNMAVDLFDYGLLFNVLGGMASDSMSRMAMGGVGLFAAAEGAISKVESAIAGFFGAKQAEKSLNSTAGWFGEAALFFGMAALLGPGLASLGTGLISIGALFFTLGVTFGFMLPLIPFMHFFFGAVSWVALLFEAVIAMPLVALAHISPEGEGISGPHARGAYQMAFSLLLRPVLMVFGLICGFVVLMLGVTILNMLFAGVTTSTHGGFGSHTIITKIVSTVFYAALLMSVANHAFQLITQIPDKVMSWGGFRGASASQMGDPGRIEGLVAAGSGYVAREGMQAAAGGARALGNSAGGAIGAAGRLAVGAQMLGMEQKAMAGELSNTPDAPTGGGSTQANMATSAGPAGTETGGTPAPSGGGKPRPEMQWTTGADGTPVAQWVMGSGGGGNAGGGGNQANLASSAGTAGSEMGGQVPTPPPASGNPSPPPTSSSPSFGQNLKTVAARSLYNYAMTGQASQNQRPWETAKQNFELQAAADAAKAQQHAEMLAALQSAGAGAPAASGGDTASLTPDPNAPPPKGNG